VVINHFSVDSDNNRIVLDVRPEAILKDSIGSGVYDQKYLLILGFDKRLQSNYSCRICR